MLKYIAGPLIGALIGFCTNFIAVKMLFYPKKEIRICGHRLPFTPGAIPKGKDRLAKAMGSVVGNTLITKEDVEQKIQSSELAEKLTDSVMEVLDRPVKKEIMDLTGIQEETYGNKKEMLSRKISETAVDVLAKVDLASLFVEKGTAIIKEKVRGTMMEMFLSDEVIASVVGPVGAEVQNMVATQGADYICPFINEKLTEMETQPSGQILKALDVEKDCIRTALSRVCGQLIHNGVDQLFATLNIQQMVEEKIDDMNVDELEDLVFTVMKKELNTITNLGAVIGFILGILNVFL